MSNDMLPLGPLGETSAVDLRSKAVDGLFDFRHAESFATRYMETFYSGHPPTDDERAVLRFLTEQMSSLESQPAMLEVGCGPTVHHVLPFVPHVSTIDMADYLPENLAEVHRWHRRAPDAYDWRQYATLTLELRNGGTTAAGIEALEAAARIKIRRLLRCDLKQPHILGRPVSYPVVGAFYCTEEVGIATVRWEAVMANLCRTVAPGGYLFLSCLRNTDFYMVGNTRYPCARISEDDVRRVLPVLGFDMRHSVIEGVAIDTQRETGVAGVVLVAARKTLQGGA
jgi:hypothetical protein